MLSRTNIPDKMLQHSFHCISSWLEHKKLQSQAHFSLIPYRLCMCSSYLSLSGLWNPMNKHKLVRPPLSHKKFPIYIFSTERWNKLVKIVQLFFSSLLLKQQSSSCSLILHKIFIQNICVHVGDVSRSVSGGKKRIPLAQKNTLLCFDVEERLDVLNDAHTKRDDFHFVSSLDFVTRKKYFSGQRSFNHLLKFRCKEVTNLKLFHNQCFWRARGEENDKNKINIREKFSVFTENERKIKY